MTKEQVQRIARILNKMDKANQVEPTYPVFIPIENQEAGRAALKRAQYPITIFDGLLIIDFRDLMRIDVRMG